MLSQFVAAQEAEEEISLWDKPEEERLVYDFMSVLLSWDEEELEDKLKGYQEQSATTVIFVNIFSLGDYTAQEVADSIYISWEVATRSDKVILALVSAKEQKAALTFPDSLGKYLNDSVSNAICEEILLPGLLNKKQAVSFSKAGKKIVKLCNPDLKAEELLPPLKVKVTDIFERPERARPVYDFADLIPEAEEQLLNQKLMDFSAQTSTQIVMVTVATLDGMAIETAANQIGRNWGIGQKGQDNGLLILTSYYDRQVRIEVGYGLEPFVSDLMAQDIIDKYIVPNYKDQNFYRGMDAASDVIIDLTKGEFHWIHVRRFWSWTRIWTYGFLAFFIIFSAYFKRRSHVWLSILSLAGLTLLVEWIYQLFGPGQHWHLWLPAIIGFLVIIDHFGKKNKKLISIQRLIKSTKSKLADAPIWEALKRTYQYPDVDHQIQIYQNWLEEIDPLLVNDQAENLDKELREFLKKPQDTLRKRGDARLTELYWGKKIQGILNNPLYDQGKRDKVNLEIREEMAYLEKYAITDYPDIPEADQKRLNQNISKLKSFLQVPSEALGYDLDWIKQEIKTFMDNNGEGYWMSTTYTTSSRKKTKKKFTDKYKNCQKKNNEEAWVQFYIQYVDKLRNRPTSFLTKVPQPKVTYSTSSSKSGSSSSSSWGSSSSSSSWGSSSSSSSWSSSSSSSSYDFGGGDFGGGGASGSW